MITSITVDRSSFTHRFGSLFVCIICVLQGSAHKVCTPGFVFCPVCLESLNICVINLHYAHVKSVVYSCLHVVCVCTCIKTVFIVILRTYSCMAVCLFVVMVLDGCEWAYRHVLCQI